ncbi:MAG: FAD-dependent oxidoreductase [Ruminococcus sp.]|nr:FAD-dependent oxidoreductase [Ruminococcus sp.]
MLSVWSNNSNLPHFKPLNEDIKTDVLIIGGGISGILCAYFLHQQGINYALVESNTICCGITKDTTAKITSQHGLIYNKLVDSLGVENAQLYLNANQKALNTYRDMCKNISCDFEIKDSYVYSIDDKSLLEEEILSLEKIHFKANLVDTHELPFNTVGAVEFKNQAQFNVLKFISSIAKDLNIYENTFARQVDNHKVRTDNNTITANKIIVCSHFPFINRYGMYFLKMYQHRSYVIALQDAKNVHGMYIDESNQGISLRNYKNLLLVGGGGHRTGKDGGNWRFLDKFAKEYYPNSKEAYRWATQDCITLDGIPYIGNYSKRTPNLYVATGFNKWGMTSSMVSAMVLTDILLKGDSIYKDIFSPSRSMLKPQLFVNGVEATKNLLTISKRRCPHMGCALHWNSSEHTWDCPCHGSRFSKHGTLIDNPSTKNAKHST